MTLEGSQTRTTGDETPTDDTQATVLQIPIGGGDQGAAVVTAIAVAAQFEQKGLADEAGVEVQAQQDELVQGVRTGQNGRMKTDGLVHEVAARQEQAVP